MSFYDTAGAVFEGGSSLIIDKGRYLARSDVVFFLLSLKKLREDHGHGWTAAMDRLLQTYVNAVYDRLDVKLQESQHLIVILSMGDELGNELPEEIGSFLRAGSFDWYSQAINRLIAKLKENSQAVEVWLCDQQCAGFVKKARDNFKSVEYTVTSATGVAPAGDQLPARPNRKDPKRVLDPLLWTLEKTRTVLPAPGSPTGILGRLFGW